MPDISLDTILERIRNTFEVSFEPLAVDEHTLDVLTIQNMTRHLDGLIARKAIHDPLRDLPLWAKVWPASFVLGRFLRRLEPEGKRLLELGAGCGVTSLVAARYGFSHISISDVNSEALDFAQANVVQNALQEHIDVRRIDITGANEAVQDFEMIVGSEILYLEALHRPLIKFFSRHLARHENACAVLCTDMARRQARFFKQAEKQFRIEEHKVGIRSHAEDGTEKRQLFLIHTLVRR